MCRHTVPAIALLLLSVLPPANADEVVLREVLPINAPVISNNRMIYTVNFILSRCPQDCWSFYDAHHQRMTLEFYDANVTTLGPLTLKGTSPIRKIEVENSETSVVISGKRAQILLSLKEELHCITKCRGDTLRVTLWKNLSPGSVVNQERKQPMTIPFIATFISTILTVTLLIYIL